VRIDVITLFPGMFQAPLETSMIGRALERGLLDVQVHDLRDWTHDKHRTVDDYSFGGGPGMVMKPEPLYESVDAVQALADEPAYVIFLTPSGKVFDQAAARALATRPRLVLVCGRYEGFDERALALADLELSIGDYVLTGGELPALVVIDATARLLPGVLGGETSAAEESFTEGLLEYPQYTRPQVYRGMEIPDVLVSGDHGRIAAWRREQSLKRTARVRPELLRHARLTDEERGVLNGESVRPHGPASEGKPDD
jgi:tRNA (guanine37-N1)-methyltransferase